MSIRRIRPRTLLSFFACALAFGTLVLGPVRRVRSRSDDSASLRGGLVAVHPRLAELHREVGRCRGSRGCLAELKERHPYLDARRGRANVRMSLQGRVGPRPRRSWLRRVGSAFELSRARRSESGNTLWIGSVKVKRLGELLAASETILGVRGLVFPADMPRLDPHYLTSETWVLPMPPEPGATDCVDPDVHHTHFAPGGHLDAGLRTSIEGVSDPDPALEVAPDVAWPPTAAELHQAMVGPLAIPVGGWVPTEVLADLRVCKVYGNPFPFCASQTYEYDDFMAIFDDGYSVHVHPVVPADELDPTVAEWFHDQFNPLEPGTSGGTFAGLEVVVDNPDIIGWLEDTTATSARELFDETQFMVPRFTLFVQAREIRVTPVWREDAYSEYQYYYSDDAPNDAEHLRVDMPAFRMQMDAGLSVAAWGDIESHVDMSGGRSDAVYAQADWVRTDQANIRPTDADPVISDNQTHVGNAAILDELERLLAGDGNDDIEPGVYPQAVALALHESALPGLASDLTDFLTAYTYAVNPLLADNETLSSTRSITAVTAAEATASYQQSSCPSAAPEEIPPIGKNLEAPDWTASVGFSVVSNGTALVGKGGLFDATHEELRGTAQWMSLTSDDLADTATFSQLGILQNLDDPQNPFGNPALADHEDFLIDLFLEVMHVGLPRADKEGCEAHWDDHLYLLESQHCEDLCFGAFDDGGAGVIANNLTPDEMTACKNGCKGYADCKVRDHYEGYCGEPDYTLYYEQPGVEICASVVGPEDGPGDPDPQSWMEDYNGDGVTTLLKSVAQRDRHDYLSAGGCEIGFPVTDLVSLPAPYFEETGDGGLLIRVPAWGDIFADICVDLDYSLDFSPGNDDEDCPGGNDGLPVSDFYEGDGPEGEVEVCGTVKIELNLEWVFELDTSRRWQWTAGWRGFNVVPNDRVGHDAQVGAFDWSDFDWGAFAGDFQMVGLQLGFDGACLGDVDDWDGDGAIDHDDYHMTNHPSYRVPKSNIDVSGPHSLAVEDQLWRKLKHPCDNEIVNWIRTDDEIAAALPELTVPIFDDTFYSLIEQYSPGTYQAALAYTFIDLEDRHDFQSQLTGNGGYSCSQPAASISDAVLAPSVLRAIHNADYAGSIYNVPHEFYAHMQPYETLVEPAAAVLGELWEEGLCGDTSYAGNTFGCDVELDNTLLTVVASSVHSDAGAPPPGESGPNLPWSSGGLYMLVFDPEEDTIPGDFASGDPHNGDGTPANGWGVGDLEDDVTHSDALPVWEPGKP